MQVKFSRGALFATLPEGEIASAYFYFIWQISRAAKLTPDTGQADALARDFSRESPRFPAISGKCAGPDGSTCLFCELNPGQPERSMPKAQIGRNRVTDDFVRRINKRLCSVPWRAEGQVRG
jgi:hypothetical protein